jgi:hypothetical protein
VNPSQEQPGNPLISSYCATHAEIKLANAKQTGTKNNPQAVIFHPRPKTKFCPNLSVSGRFAPAALLTFATVFSCYTVNKLTSADACLSISHYGCSNGKNCHAKEAGRDQ